MFDPIKRMIKRTVGSRVDRIEDNSKTYNQVNNEVLEKVTLSYDENLRLYNVEGEDVMVADLSFDDMGRIESVLESNKITDRVVEYTFKYDPETYLLIEVIPVVLNEGDPVDYEEEGEDTSSYVPETPDEDDIDLNPTSSGSIGDYDWREINGEGERM